MISRRSIVLGFLWMLAIAIPTAYTKGRIFEIDQLNGENGLEIKTLHFWPIVFARTVADGEPGSIKQLALAGVMLTGICIVSLAFDYAPKNRELQEQTSQPKKLEEGEAGADANAKQE